MNLERKMKEEENKQKQRILSGDGETPEVKMKKKPGKKATKPADQQNDSTGQETEQQQVEQEAKAV